MMYIDLKIKMKLNLIIMIFITACLLGSCGCGGGSTPSEPVDLRHRLLGVWELEIDVIHQQLNVKKMNMEGFPVNVWMTQPKFFYKDFDDVDYVVHIDAEIENLMTEAVWDPRMILFTDDLGNILTNGDHLTALYDLPGGEVFNPYKAFCTDKPERVFEINSKHLETLEIHLPGGTEVTTITLAIEGSRGQNCVEPYEFANFISGEIFPQKGSNGYYNIDVYDWQGDTESVALYCPEITDRSYVHFTPLISNTWALNLENYVGAPVGDYTAVIMASSEDSGDIVLAEIVTITISPDIYPPRWVATEGLLSLTPGNGFVTLFWGMATDKESTQPIKYYVYKDTDDYPWDQDPYIRGWHDPFLISGLENGVKYYFNVRCIDTADPPNMDDNTVVLSATPNG